MLLDTVGDPDFVKVLDFGIAKILSGSSADSGVTRAGAVVGTPQFMAPEQAQGRGVTPAVDVYSVGILVYEALTGVRTFDGESAVGILMAHVRSPVPEIPARCPASPGMRALVRRMLAKEPAQRPQAAELVRAFEQMRMAALLPGAGAAEEIPAAPAETLPDAETACLTTPIGGEPAEEPVCETEAIRPVGPGAVEGTLAMPPPVAVGTADKRGRRMGLGLAGLAAVVIAGIGLVLAMTGDESPQAVPEPLPVTDPVSPEPAMARPPQPPPVVAAVAPAPDKAALPPSLHVRFESDPPGARVLDGYRDLGTTPFESDWTGPATGKRFTFRLERHRDTPITADLRPGSTVFAKLERLPAGPAASTRRPVPAVVPAPAPAPGQAPAPRKFRPVVD